MQVYLSQSNAWQLAGSWNHIMRFTKECTKHKFLYRRCVWQTWTPDNFWWVGFMSLLVWPNWCHKDVNLSCFETSFYQFNEKHGAINLHLSEHYCNKQWMHAVNEYYFCLKIFSKLEAFLGDFSGLNFKLFLK